MDLGYFRAVGAGSLFAGRCALMTGPIRVFDRLYLRQNASLKKHRSVKGSNLQVWNMAQEELCVSFHLQIYEVSAAIGAAWMWKVCWEPSLICGRLPPGAEFICLISLVN